MKILIGPIEIAGYYSSITKGFKNLGYYCDFICYTEHPFKYGGESKTPFLIKFARYLNQTTKIHSGSASIKIFCMSLREIAISIWAIYAILKYDVFIFGFGQSLLRNSFDLRILKKLNKTVIMNVAHGADARPPYIDGAYQDNDGKIQPSLKILKTISERKFESIKRIEKYSQFIIGAPLSSTQFTNIKLINSFAIGNPVDYSNELDITNISSVSNETFGDKKIRILHSPSHPAVKGTEIIIKALDNLKSKGYNIDLILLHGVTHKEVLIEIQSCDFVIDQIYSDTPMAGFAAEAAWFGKPAIVGGYGFKYLKNLIPPGMWPPSKICHPDEIETAVEDFILNTGERLKLGKEAKNFVRKKWSATEVAKRYLRIIKQDIPDNWWIDPNEVQYVMGTGQTNQRTTQNVQDLVKQYGVASLKLGHRPKLEKAFLDFHKVNISN